MSVKNMVSAKMNMNWMFIRRIAEDRALCFREKRFKKAMKLQKLRTQENSPWKFGVDHISDILNYGPTDLPSGPDNHDQEP